MTVSPNRSKSFSLMESARRDGREPALRAAAFQSPPDSRARRNAVSGSLSNSQELPESSTGEDSEGVSSAESGKASSSAAVSSASSTSSLSRVESAERRILLSLEVSISTLLALLRRFSSMISSMTLLTIVITFRVVSPGLVLWLEPERSRSMESTVRIRSPRFLFLPREPRNISQNH